MMCLSFDHRIIDGASADGFMKRLVESLTALGNAK
jgi:pyruvate/2-oxoglutarate dehydrogenase complex dihydrolipoamide acyltransferase (E2) component